VGASPVDWAATVVTFRESTDPSSVEVVRDGAVVALLQWHPGRDPRLIVLPTGGHLATEFADYEARAMLAELARRSRPKGTAQAVPPMTEREVNVRDMKLVDSPSYEVCSWRDGPAHSTIPCTQVHLVLNVGPVSVVVRLKSKRALDELVGALLQHRQDVWGERVERDAPKGGS
jgi:hypothetical protein